MNCNYCSFTNNIDSQQCEICDSVLDDDDFVTRWKSANYLIIGACYNNDDTKFWSQLDPNYIGIGMGDHCFKNKPIWQTNWNAPGFWESAKPVRETGFKYIFLDRCVWNIVMNNFKPVLDFVYSLLQENGCFLISKSSWKPANDIFIKNQFIKSAEPVFKRLPENEVDLKVVDLIIQNGKFMITNGYIASIDFMKNEIVDESKTLLLDRKKWKAFMKLKPMIKK
jgi:hypothetical protein